MGDYLNEYPDGIAESSEIMEDDLNQYPDRIAGSFNNSNVFITGGTGFIGKALIEKILRVTNVKKIYLLTREKKGISPMNRLFELTKDPIYGPLRKRDPSLFAKCQIISGDVTLPGLGISAKDRELLTNEVDIIYHSAATVRFDDTLKYALIMNTRGTKFMLDLAKECKNLKVFIHISTAYVQPKEEILYEKVYPTPADPHAVLKSLEWLSEEALEKIRNEILMGMPNAYTFTKALSEALVAEQMDTLPVMILRPSVVIPVLFEPLPGWSKNLQNAAGLLVAAGKGILRSMWVKSDSYADFITVDIAVNGFIGAPWYFNNNKNTRVVNIVSGAYYKLTWEDIIESGRYVVNNIIPFNGVVWYPGGSLKKSRNVHLISFYIFQIIPAVIIDVILRILGFKPILYGIQRRIQKSCELLEYYTWKDWKFDNTTLLQGVKTLNPREKQIYKDGMSGLDILKYLTNCILYIRRHILHEPDHTIPRAKFQMKVMWAVDKIAKCLLIFAFLYYTYKLLSVIC